MPCRKERMSFRPKKAVPLSAVEGDAKHRGAEKSIIGQKSGGIFSIKSEQ